VIEVREATGPESAPWRADWRARLQAWYGTGDVPAEWAGQQVDSRLASHAAAARGGTFALTERGTAVGMLALSAAEQGGLTAALVSDVWIGEQYRGKGRGTEAIRWAESWAQSQGATAIWVSTDPAQPSQAGLFRNYPVRAHQMIKKLTDRGELASGLQSRPMSEAEFVGWRTALVRGYAADIASSGSVPDAQAAAQAVAETDELLLDGLRTANHSFLCLCADGEVVATNWLCHHRGPGVSWVYGVEVSKSHRGKGFGRAAMIIGERATLDAGDSHLALNVFGHNDVAIGLYHSMRYRAYELDRSISL
jgi:GNAT superfamily N-acetyltransferase